MRWTSRTGLWIAALAAFALYLPSLGYDFVYDSYAQVMVDPFIHQARHFADVLSLRVLGMDVLDFNRPLNLLSLMVDAQLWGKNPAGFRLTNLFLHAAAAALLFRWLRLLTGSLGASLLAALAFAVHPLHTETVVEIGYREDLLATVFLLAGFNAAVAFRPGERVWGPGLLAGGCFFLAAAAKETGIAGPVVLATYVVLFRWHPPEGRRAWLALLGGVTLAVGLFYGLRFGLEPKHSVIFTEKPASIGSGLDWLLTQSRIWTAEGLRVLWPTSLCAAYGPYCVRNIDGAGALVGVLAAVTGGAALSLLNRRAALGCILFGAAMLPVSNLVPIYRPMADRYLYLPMTGLALLLALALAACRSRGSRAAVWTAAGLAVVLLAATTLRQERFWRDGSALWAEQSRLNPVSSEVWVGRGDAAYDQARYAEALGYYEKAAELTRGLSFQAWAGIALAEEALHQPEKAAQALERATKLDSRFARPETLVRALIYPEAQAQRFSIIARRAQPR